MPVGAFGGRRDLMRHLAPEGDVYQAGTLSGNPVAMAAGVTTLAILEREQAWSRLEELGRHLEAALAPALAGAPFPVQLVRQGSLFWMSLQAGVPPRRADAIDSGAARALQGDLPRAAGARHRPGAFGLRSRLPLAGA